ncbi:endonuclease VII domain-containing protein [Streptomyces sp. NPDC090442]|uniref:endonuclease VII domain-containing protein n=1 Tax=Streptomyces sp. NPDC090442 TaxID=3365962 RepID=UPI003827CACF
MTVKPCGDCRDLLPLARFPKHVRSADGRTGRCRVCTAVRRKRARNPARERERRLWTAYGITGDEYRAMGARQCWRCLVCGERAPKGVRLVVDHDHATGRVRGLLHSECNAALGLLRDRPDWLERAARYVSRHAEPRTQVGDVC